MIKTITQFSYRKLHWDSTPTYHCFNIVENETAAIRQYRGKGKHRDSNVYNSKEWISGDHNTKFRLEITYGKSEGPL
jgi:hypothetical protein